MTAIEFLMHAAQAVVGAYVVLSERDDDTETWGPLRLTTSVWSGIAVALCAGLTYDAGLEWWRWAAAVAVFAVVLTDGHSTVLQGPSQACVAKIDRCDLIPYWLFKRRVGDVMGWPCWLLAVTLRYPVPLLLMGWLLDKPVAYAVAGVVTVVGYWPVAYWCAKGEVTKFFGAAIFGAAVFGVM